MKNNELAAPEHVRIPRGTDLNNFELDTDFADYVGSLRLDLSDEIPEPPIVLEINSQPFGTLGNFSLVTGKAKSKKTFFVTMIAYSAVNNVEYGTIKGRLPEDKKRVILIDTEQSRFHAHNVLSRICKLSGDQSRDLSQPDNLEYYCLRETPFEKRTEVIGHIIRNTPDLGLVIIDGIKDIVSDINSGIEATQTADKLLEWTSIYDIHIVLVLHQNKGDTNVRGHLGTELVNKAETVVSVAKESSNTEVSKVEAEYTRDKEFEPLGFKINDNGLPEIVEGWRKKDESRRRTEKISPGEMENYKHFQLLQCMKQKIESSKPKRKEILNQIKLAFHHTMGQSIGENKALEYLTYYMNENAIQKHGKDHSPNTYYSVHPSNVQHNTQQLLL